MSEEREKSLIYWVRNGELMKNSELAEQILNQIPEKEPIKVWVGKREKYGQFVYRVFTLDGIDGLIIVMDWVSESGYRWEECKIYILRF
jgi:hypothetical protein